MFSRFTSAPTLSMRRNSGIGLAAMVIAIIGMMALPLPPWSLDILVAINISAGVMLLLIALYMPTPLAFSTFPSVLLLTTLFRISLNVATARQILLRANGGHIIDAFGHMVVGGSLVVGLVIFLIITVVQFIVVAKGAERVAEVGARFTLDALPGKQLSIDADLRSGTITQADAIRLRQHLIQESHFYGSMDGAMKFVKGDAIAGIVIVAVNLLGGISIGTLSMGMSLGDAIHRYAVLSIGDGLVTQIPALFVSIAAGIVITRSSPENSATHLGEQIGRQLASQPHAMLLSSGVMAMFSMVPGFPTITFLSLAALTATAGITLSRRQRQVSASQKSTALTAAAREGESMAVQLNSERPSERPPSAFRLDISATLIERLGAEALDQALKEERAVLWEEFGLPFPGLDLRINTRIPDNSFQVRIQNLVDQSLFLPPSAVFVTGQLSSAQWAQFRQEHKTLEFASPPCLPGQWIDAAHGETLSSSDSTWPVHVLPPNLIMARVVMDAVQRNPASVLGVQEVRQMLRSIEPRYGDLAREAQAVLPLGRLADFMITLARERVPISDFPGLLQAIITHAATSEDMHELYEALRKAMARGIVASVLPTGAWDTLDMPPLNAITLTPRLQALLLDSKVIQSDGPVLAMEPQQVDMVRQALRSAFERAGPHKTRVLALSGDLRRAVSRLYRTDFPQAVFLSHDELTAASVVAVDVGQADILPASQGNAGA